MMTARMKWLMVAVVAMLLGSVSQPARADEGWQTYRSAKYGFSMLIPAGTGMKEREWSGGWGGLHGRYEGLELWGVAKLGKQYSPEEIERYGVKVTGIADKHWKLIDKGEGSKGWKWYRTVMAASGNTVFFGGYGTGPKGSYLLVLKTTKSDYQAHKTDYDKWYESVTLD